MVDKQKLRELKNKLKIEELEKELNTLKETNNMLMASMSNLYSVMDIELTAEMKQLLDE